MFLSLFMIAINLICSLLNYWLDNMWWSGFSGGITLFLIANFIMELFE